MNDVTLPWKSKPFRTNRDKIFFLAAAAWVVTLKVFSFFSSKNKYLVVGFKDNFLHLYKIIP